MTSLRRVEEGNTEGWNFGWVLKMTQDLNTPRWGGGRGLVHTVRGMNCWLRRGVSSLV